MSAATHPVVAADPDQIRRFFHAAFRRGSTNTFLAARAFVDGTGKVAHASSLPLADALGRIIALAGQAAASGAGVTVAPPLATFRTGEKATEGDVAEGLVLTVDCDEADPRAAVATLAALLGKPTAIVASGGIWTNPETGEVLDRLHLHWRLAVPTRSPADHDRLKDARRLAARLIGGDGSMAPLSHPCRWPGTVHAKRQPRRLAQIVALDDGAEIDLTAALDALRAAGDAFPPARGAAVPGAAPGALVDPALLAPGGPGDVVALLAALPNPDLRRAEWWRVGAAAFAASGGAEEGRAAWLDWSEKAPKYGRAHQADASREWGDCGRRNGTQAEGHAVGWRTLMGMIKEAVPGWAVPSETIRQADTASARHDTARDDWPEPQDMLREGEMVAAPELRPDHLPAALAGFVFDTAARMGVDPATVALFAVVVSSAAASDEWALQPTRNDDTWTEQPRLWGAVVGAPSSMKSPVLAAATRPFDTLEKGARGRHEDAMQIWKAKVAELKANKVPPEGWPSQPKRDRYLIEGATVEALSEVLRDDADAKQRAPSRKVLVRQDEMAGWIGAMDQYKAGGKGGGDRSAYLRLYNGGAFVLDRIGRGAFTISNWSGCVLGGIQPEPIQRIANDGDDDGLLQRFLFVVPVGDGEGQDRKPDAAALARYHGLIPRLAALRPGQPGAVRLHPDAHRHRLEIDALVKAMAGAPSASPRLKSSLGKWRGTFARLALTFHLVELADGATVPDGGNPFDPPSGGAGAMIIPEATARLASAYMAEILMPHLLRADALLFGSVQTGHSRWVAGFILASPTIRQAGRVTARDIQRAYGALRPPEQRRGLEAVLEGLEAAGWVRPEPRRPGAAIGAWRVNPAVYSRFYREAGAERGRRDAAREAVTASARQFRPEHPHDRGAM